MGWSRQVVALSLLFYYVTHIVSISVPEIQTEQIRGEAPVYFDHVGEVCFTTQQ